MATWFRFDRPFDFRVRLGVEIAYPAPFEGLIPETHARAAEKAGAGARIQKPEKATHANLRRQDA